MGRFFSLLGALLINYAPSLMACEGCKEPSNVAGDSGVAGISASFSWSVIFMIGMLAFLLTGLVIMMVRSCRQLAAQHNRFANPTPANFTIRRSPWVVLRTAFAMPAVSANR